METADQLFGVWQKLGKNRSQQRQRDVGALRSIRRGVGCMHLANRRLEIRPHIHATIVTDHISDDEELSIRDRIKALGCGYVDITASREPIGASVRYSIDGPIPSDQERITEIRGFFQGVRLVRRIGK